MRWGFWSSYVWVVAIAVAITGPPRSLGRPQGTPPTILRHRVASFRVERLPLLDALLQLGQDQGVPLGIEYVDREAVEKPISVKLDGATVGEIIERLLGMHKGYSWQFREGVLTVGHEPVGPAKGNLLDHVIPEFSVSRCSVSEASHLLGMDLDLELHPQIRGFAGDYSPGDLQNLIGPLKVRNVPVWRVLNRLVSANRKAAWIVQAPLGHLDNLPSYGLWTIVEYENPPRRYAEVLRKTVWGSTPNPADGTSWLQKRVCRFIFHGMSSQGGRHHSPIDVPGGIIEAMRQLASHAEVPICIEELHTTLGGTVVPIEIDVGNASVKDILEDMVAQEPRYEYRERLGVVEVFPRNADRDRADCLNLTIPVFRARNEWNLLMESLRCEVRAVSLDDKTLVADPWADSRGGGCGGSFPGLAHPPPGLIDANFENRTVRDILDLLCAKVGNMAWNADFDNPAHWLTDQKEKRTASPLSCHEMSIHVYQPRPWSPSDTGSLTWFEGLPKACLKCHYHQPCSAK